MGSHNKKNQDKQNNKNRVQGIKKKTKRKAFTKTVICKKKTKRKAFTKTVICPEGVHPTQQERPIKHVLENHCNEDKRGEKSQFLEIFSANTVIELINYTILNGEITSNKDKDKIYVFTHNFTIGECFYMRQKEKPRPTRKMLVATRSNGILKSAYPIL